jgi:uncharacterized surface protein with fasciclin (FAS1) repeats
LFGAMVLGGSALLATGNTMVGSASSASKDIIDNAVSASDLTTLVAAVKAGGLVETLKGKGPFTVFAPTNEAFAKLPAGTLDSLLKPENKPALVKILTYHVVPGKIEAGDLIKMIKAGNGSTTFKTVQGETLTASLKGSSVVIKDQKGGFAMVTIADMNASNGVIHVIDAVLLPN